MSAIDTSCYSIKQNTEGGAGEMSCYKLPPNGEPTSYLIASEIMNDVLDNVFEVVMAKQLQPPSPRVVKITPSVVGDILENILSPNLRATSNKQDETILLDEDIKKIIQEMKYPPEQKNMFSTQGVGDQLVEKSEITPNKVILEPVKRNTLERKNRLTNLVRNSKQMLSKFVSTENENEVRLVKSEEVHEKLLKVIDLEGDDHYVEPGCSNSTGILQMPPESTLHMIDLDRNVHSEGEDTERNDEEKADYSSRTDSKKETSSGKKKMGLGAKILKYLKRNKEVKKQNRMD